MIDLDSVDHGTWAMISSLMEAREARARRSKNPRAEVLDTLVARDMAEHLDAILASINHPDDLIDDDDWL